MRDVHRGRGGKVDVCARRRDWRASVLLGAVAVLWAACSSVWAEGYRVDADLAGNVWGIVHDDSLVAVRANFTVAAGGWKTRLGAQHARDRIATSDAHSRTWKGTLPLGDAPAFRFEQTIDETDPDVGIRLRVQSLAEQDLDGVFFDIKVPAAEFSGGKCTICGPDGEPRPYDLPPPETRGNVLKGTAQEVVFRPADGGRALAVVFDSPYSLSVAASPGWLMPHYRVLVSVHTGAMKKDEVASASIRFSFRGTSDRSPAHLRLDASRELYRLEGFGGNYCYWPNTPAVDYTLDNLKPVWARTQMALDFWEVQNDDADPDHINWEAFRDKEKGQWILQAEMTAAGKMARRGIPFIISCWRVPGWMLIPESEAGDHGGRPIARSAWPELMESICSYLLYVRDEYGAEPAMFSFNEPILGRMPDAQHHREFSKLLGKHLAAAGLTTRILAGDVANPRGERIDYARPLLDDPEGRAYVDGLSFHSWGGATAETYGAWAGLARRHGVPLFVGELGWNAMAHRGGSSVHTLCYAVQELALYQDILLHAQPQVLLHWEYGGSYPLLVEKDGALEPTARYRFIEQLATLTPQPAAALSTECDSRRVRFTAFRGSGEGGVSYALHIANLGADRTVVLAGLPQHLDQVKAVQLPLRGGRQPADTVRPSEGVLRMHVPALSLVTLHWTEE